MTDDFESPIAGPYGIAEEVPLEGLANAGATLCAWLITSSVYHPLWNQYLLAVVGLGEVPGFPPAKLKFPGASHELIVHAIDPKDGTVYKPTDGRFPQLIPINICEQYEATDAEMTEVAWLACRAVVHGGLNPETADAPTRIREQWLSAVTKTLAHIRGEEHAP